MKSYDILSNMVHKEGYIFIAIALAATFVFASLNTNLGWICLYLTVLCVYFFRNPQRVTPVGDELIISAADGIVVGIDKVKPPAELQFEEEMLKVSVFLNVLNVHVNRIPVTGKVLGLYYNPGEFLNASLDKASVDNERQAVVIETKKGEKIAVVQIAGLIARRIVCDLEEEMEVKSGQRYGIIRFGSRVDLYLPADTVPQVAIGQTVVGGETIIGKLGTQPKNELEFEVRN